MSTLLNELRCRLCGHTVAAGPVHVCEECFGPLEVVYDDAAVRRTLTRDAIASNAFAQWGERDALAIAGIFLGPD